MIKGLFKLMGWCILAPIAIIHGMLQFVFKTYK